MFPPDATNPVKIRLESANYALRTMEPADALLDWGRWMANPMTARLLNAVPRQISLQERQAYVASFDARTSHLLGVWQKMGSTLVGVWAVYVDPARKEFLLNVMVGPTEERDRGALKETRDLIYDYFFITCGLEAARCTVVAQNTQMIAFLQRHHWRHEGVSHKQAAQGPQTVTIHHFRLSREDWQRRFSEGEASIGAK